MISLEQIKQLETRVHSAVARIQSLTAENTTLQESLTDYEKRIDELEKLISGFKSEQQEIEAGIIAALSQLDSLEDAVAESPVDSADGSAQNHQPVAPEVSDEPSPAGEPESPSDEADTADDPADFRPAEPASESPSSELDGPDEEEPELDIF
jgi:FtsZ-binding cell division protein ZapB